MSDFLSREADILGGDFSSNIDASGDDFDFEHAASAFPDISLDGTGDFDVPTPAPPAAARASSGFSFDDFGSPPRETQSAIKVTGDDELDRFESDFPDIDVGQVSNVIAGGAVVQGVDIACPDNELRHKTISQQISGPRMNF